MTFPALFTYPLLVVVLMLIGYIQPDKPSKEEILETETLDDYELKLLHDFVRRRGKGSVSRIPFEDIFLEREESAEPSFRSNNVINIGGQMHIGEMLTTEHPKTIQRNSSESTKLSSAKFNESQNEPNFEQLAALLKKLVGRRKGKASQRININTNRTMDGSIGSNLLVENASLADSTFILIDSRPQQSSSKRISTGTLRSSKPESTHISNVEDNRSHNTTMWSPSMHKSVTKDNDIAWLSSKNRDAEWESKMRELTRQLSIFLSSMKRQKEIDGSLTERHYEAATTINALKQRAHANGSAVQYGDNEYEFIASIVLIQDQSTNILVDTGLGTDTRGRTHMLQMLSNLSINPLDVHYVVITDGHPAHSGNTNDFPDAFHYAGDFIHYRTRFNFSQLFEGKSENLTRNVYLLKTPGHSSDGISVVVRNAGVLGTIAISGDIFVQKEDLTNAKIWRPLSINETLQADSRRKLICLANYIVPGHGQMFAVTELLKNEYRCATKF